MTPADETARRRLAAFADLIADDVSIPDAAKALGFSHATGKRLMRQLRQEMGEV